ncbi:MAG: hypothetical protein ACSHXK_17170 [Oceanococcus sp.]
MATGIAEAAIGDLAEIPCVAAAITQRTDAYTCYTVPCSDSSDYEFQLFVYSDGEPQISARLLADPDAYFWYLPFELEQYGCPEAAQKEFQRIARKILSSETCVLQSNGLISHTFDLFILENRERKLVGSTLVLRFGVRTPPIEGKNHEYSGGCANDT